MFFVIQNWLKKNHMRNNMKKLLELGDHYVSDFIKDDSEMAGRKKYSLDLYLDD